MPANLTQGPRVSYDARVGAGLSRGPTKKKLLNAAAWSQTWPAPGATLDLDFANNRGFVRDSGQGGVMDAITFTRASNGTFVGPDGLLQGSGGPQGARGLNLLTFPQDFDNGAWGKVNSSVQANVAVAPDGSYTADKAISTTTNGFHITSQTVSTSATTYTASIYVKRAEYSLIGFDNSDVGGTNGVGLGVDLTNGSITAAAAARGTGFSVVSSSVTDAGGGWYRVILTFSAPAGSLQSCKVNSVNNLGQGSFAGDGTSGVLIWGAQLELGSTATTYYPTNYNTPRFDWEANKALTIPNYFRYTHEFDNGYWEKSGVTVTANAIAAPDGTLTADLITESATTGAHRLLVNNGNLGIPFRSTTMVYSLYVKYNGRQFVYLQNNINSSFACFDILNGTVIGTTTSASINNIGDGWYRIIYVYYTDAVNPWNNSFWLFLSSAAVTFNTNPVTYTGDGSSGIYVWGAQFEVGTVPAAYKEVGGQRPANTPIAANSTCNGILIEEARTNRLLWCRDATRGTGTNLLRGSSSAVSWVPVNGTIGNTSAELVSNGNFSNGSTGWALTSGWSVSGGVAVANIASGFNDITQLLTLTAGKTYLISFDITSRTSGAVSAYLGNSGSFDATVISANSVGTYKGTITFVAGQFSGVLIRAENGFVGSVGNISVKEVSYDGITDPNGNPTAATATATGENATFTQSVFGSTTPYTFSVWLRRKTGTGNVDISVNGTTWVTQPITTSWARYLVTQSSTGTMYSGIRIVTLGDAVEVWGPQLFPSYALTDYQATTSFQLFGWSKSNVTLICNQTGIDGVANSATSITANAANAFLVQPVVLGGNNRTCSAYLKRIVGVGEVQVSLDGNTWSTVELSNTEWRRVVLSGNVIFNPVFAVKLKESGDSIAMDYAQVEDGIFATSPILTTSATTTRSVDSANIGGNINTRIGEERLYSTRGSTIYAEYGRASNLGGDVFRIWGAGSAISTISVNGQAAVVGISGTYAVGATGFLVSDFNRACVSYSRSKLNFSASGISSVQRNENNINIFGSVIWIGNYGNGTGIINGCIKRIVFAPFDLSTEGTKNMTSAT